ncbi:hydrogenase [Desulfopila sp. IMCC35006]|uniref:proton-conducting transporter transmembrane domain-containing protein n=1 Tax=Desulfopila sp. IMCC35006 TaxID=2569542 RepID=UPI0010AD44C4|nr:proton-conducting transporter membrane subunit [Desulfopila sp. IMCC35006]TKB26944.1 hydrogenase [Desulfopila sp. IMCC35006]
MNFFLLSLAIIVVGGTIPLLTFRHFVLTKCIYVSVTAVGCISGLSALLSAASSPESLAWSWAWQHVFTLSFSFDSLSLFFLLPVFLICPLAAMYSFFYFERAENSLKTAVSYFFTNILIVSMALVTAASNMLAFALVWELMSISSYFLVMYDYEKVETRTAGYLYFLFAQGGALLIFAAFGVIFSHNGSFDFSRVVGIPDSAKLVVFFLAFLGFGSKAGVFPLHIWLPHAHPAAPSHISAIMSGVMIKMGIYGILRMYFMLGATDIRLGQTVLILGMISGLLGVLYALGKRNIKRMLAYSSVENIGIILMGAGFGMIGIAKGNSLMAGFGFAGCLLHVLNHSIFKSLLFLGAGAVIRKTGISRVDLLGGLMKRMPITGKTFLAGSLSISGLPPFSGFVSEFLIYFAAFQGLKYNHINLLLSIIAIISLAAIGGLATFCFTKVVGIVFLGEPRTEKVRLATDGGWTLTVPLSLLAIACLGIGIFPAPFITLAFSGLADVSFVSQVDPQLVQTIGTNLGFASRLFLIIIFAVILLRKALYRRKENTAGPTWGCGFTRPTTRIQYTGASFSRSVIDFFRPFALSRETEVRLKKIFPERTRYASWVEDVAEVGMRQGLALPLLSLLGKFRWIQHGNVQLYIGYIIVAILILLLILFI